MAKSNETKITTMVVLGIVATMLLFSFALKFYLMGFIVRWNGWVNTIHIVSQPGSDVQDVKAELGEPEQIKKPREVLMECWIPPIKSVPKSDQVYIYHCYGEYLWKAYIFIDSTGHVVGSHIASS
jgi:hypothetical protein